jgi:DNA-binding phage protein
MSKAAGVPRPRTAKPRNLELAALGQAIEVRIAEVEDMTQETVAAESGLDQKLVGDYMRGRGNPTYTSLLKLCKGLHIRPAKLTKSAEALLEKRLGS